MAFQKLKAAIKKGANKVAAKLHRKQLDNVQASSTLSSDSTLVPNRPRLLPSPVVADTPCPRDQTTRPRKLQKRNKMRTSSCVGPASILPLPAGLEVTRHATGHNTPDLNDGCPTLPSINHVASFTDDLPTLQNLQLESVAVHKVKEQIHDKTVSAQVAFEDASQFQGSGLHDDAEIVDSAPQEEVVVEEPLRQTREHAQRANSEDNQDAEQPDWLTCVPTYDLAHDENSDSALVAPIINTIATAGLNSEQCQSLIRCDSRNFSTMPGFAAYMVQNFACNSTARPTTIENMTSMSATNMVFGSRVLEAGINRRFFELMLRPSVPAHMLLDSRSGLLFSDLNSLEEDPLMVSCSCDEKLREMEADYEVAARIMEQRHETELSMIRDDYEAELSALKEEQEKVSARQSARISKLRDLAHKREGQITKLEVQLVEQTNTAATHIELLQERNDVLEEECSKSSTDYINVTQAYQRIEAQQLASQSAALAVQHQSRITVNNLRDQLAGTQNQLTFALEREQDLIRTIREMAAFEAQHQAQIKEAKEHNEELQRLNDIIVEHKHLEYQQRGSCHLPYILQPDEVQAAERALLMSQDQAKKLGAELTTSTLCLESALSEIKQLKQEKALLQADLETYKDTHLISSNVAEVYEDLADRFIEAAVSVPENVEIKEFCLKSLQTATSEIVLSNKQAEQILDLRVELRAMTLRHDEEGAQHKARVQELEDTVRETDVKFFTAQTDLEMLEAEHKELKQNFEASKQACANLGAQLETQALGSDREYVLQTHWDATEKLKDKIDTLRHLVFDEEQRTIAAGTCDTAVEWNAIWEAGCAVGLIEERDALLITKNTLLDRFQTELAQEPLEINPYHFVKHTPMEQQILNFLHPSVQPDSAAFVDTNPRWKISPEQEQGLRAAVAAAKTAMSDEQQKEAEKIFLTNCTESEEYGPDSSWATADDEDIVQEGGCPIKEEEPAASEETPLRVTAFGLYDEMWPRAYVAVKSPGTVKFDTPTRDWYDKETF